MFYVFMVSWVELDDDKLPFCSPKMEVVWTENDDHKRKKNRNP